jgi:hypothetical protein
MFGERFARGPLAGERRHRRRLGDSHLGGDLILGGRTLQLLELQLDLIEKPRHAFRARAIKLARQLLDPELLVGDQGLIIGGFGAGNRKFGFGGNRPRGLGNPLIARNDERRLQRFDVIWKRAKTRIHVRIESQIRAADSQKRNPRQIIPPAQGGSYEPGSSNRFRRAYMRAATPRFQSHHLPEMAR